jgi:hypothetical protein
VAISFFSFAVACALGAVFFLLRMQIWWGLVAFILAIALAAVSVAVLEPTDCSKVGLIAKENRCRAGDRAECERYRTSLVRCGFDVPSDLPRP